MTKPDGGPAFPEAVSADSLGGLNYSGEGGMSLRDYFAAKAMAELLGWPDVTTDQGRAHIGALAYQMADAMIAERNKDDSAADVPPGGPMTDRTGAL